VTTEERAFPTSVSKSEFLQADASTTFLQEVAQGLLQVKNSIQFAKQCAVDIQGKGGAKGKSKSK